MSVPVDSDVQMSDGPGNESDLPDEASAQLLRASGSAPANDAVPEFSVVVPAFESLGSSRDQYASFPEETSVQRIREEVEFSGQSHYKARFADGRQDLIPFNQLIRYDNWAKAFEDFQNGAGTPVSAMSSAETQSRHHSFSSSSRGRQGLRSTTNRKNAASPLGSALSGNVYSSEESEKPTSNTRTLRKRNLSQLAKQRKAMQEAQGIESSEDEGSNKLLRQAKGVGRRTRSSGLAKVQMLPHNYRDSEDDLVVSDLHPPPTGRSRRGLMSTGRSRAQRKSGDLDYEEGERRSGRTTGRKDMYRELDPGVDDFMDFDPVTKPKKTQVIRPKEVFPSLDKNGEFARFHNRTCDTCLDYGTSKTRGRLVYCQGCSYSYHQGCLGNRTGRDHLVTKVSGGDYVLQCKRCIGKIRVKKPTAPYLDRCTACRAVGKSCKPFSDPKTKSNNTQKKDVSTSASAETSDVEVDPERLYRSENVLFRCRTCRRAWHYGHLPKTVGGSSKGSAKDRLEEYSGDWTCDMCQARPKKMDTILAWRPFEEKARMMELDLIDHGDFVEDEREYLVKFVQESYFQCVWLPGSWVCGVASHLHSAFLKKYPALHRTAGEAIPEDWLRIEICFDVQYNSYIPTGEDVDVDIRRITDVTKAYVKFRGLGYEESVWEKPPKKRETERWNDWKQAYDDYIHGFYVHKARNSVDKAKKARSLNFDQKLVRKTQPSYVKGGSLMDYQLEGLNWLYYKWWKGQNAILADEMGLGKTIQVISFLSVLLEEHNVWPFLIVVPSSTVANWKREIQHWIPSMRVVAYPGLDVARKLSRKYELFHAGTQDIKCHVVVTAYGSPVTDSRTLKPIKWQGLIVDEGQRLKNDSSQFYTEMAKYNTGFKVLMTGTPLQNNPRELFNLLQFLDPKIQADEMEEEFGVLTKENVPALHALIRPYFLRRTKDTVLDLPPMTEIIVPVSMTTVQRKLYKSILTKDTILIKSILAKHGKEKIGAGERTKLNNLLMQLRKCLCHPFLYNADVEERDINPEVMHKNLVDAGAKLELLNILLPKLREKGHRVLMFTQFLGMLDILEDFLAVLGLTYNRLDGSVSSLERQKRIDAYNAPNSDIFAFMLSTRAGGVGINLATADTVIILDPDFNPHQDIQALSRAHRIGQKSKVQVFHLVTRDTAEEKIIQMGKKKLSLDHLIIEKMDSAEEEEVDVESILKFGARALFEDEGEASEARRIHYDDESVEKLLERSAMEEPPVAEKDGDKSAESAFSFARVWANDKSTLEEGLGEEEDENAPMGFWDKVLKEREEEAQREAAAKAEELGRGRRNKKVDYRMGLDFSPRKADGASSDTDFQDSIHGSDLDENPEEIGLLDRLSEAAHGLGDGNPLPIVQGPTQLPIRDPRINSYIQHPQPSQHLPVAQFAYPIHHSFITASISNPNPFPVPARINDHIPPADATRPPGPVAPVVPHMVPPPLHVFNTAPSASVMVPAAPNAKCVACGNHHIPGRCQLKDARVEFCPVCSTAHFGDVNACPHLRSETQVNEMLKAVNMSPEDPALTADVRQLLRERKGEIKRQKKEAARRKQASIDKGQQASSDNGQRASIDKRPSANGGGSLPAPC